jgi:hypothetical protein
LTHVTFSPDVAAMPVDDALHRRWSNACSSELLLVMKTLKGSKKLAGVPHVEPGTVIPHQEDALLVLLKRTDLKLCIRLP